MLILTTKWGDYNLNNALQILVFKTKNEEVWEVYLNIDNYRQLLQQFKSEYDAQMFETHLQVLLRCECKYFFLEERKFFVIELNKLCKMAMREIEEDAVAVVSTTGVVNGTFSDGIAIEIDNR